MELKNTTDFPDWFLRRMIGWICRHKAIEHKVGDIWRAKFRNTNQSGFAGTWGRAWPSSCRFTVTVSSQKSFHEKHKRVYSLVKTTAHEIAHLAQEDRVLRGRHCEMDARWAATQVIRTFRDNAEALTATWMAEPAYASRPKAPKKTAVQKRAENAERKLKEWERKLKAAENRVKHWRKKVRYYERKKEVDKRGEVG